MLKSCTWAGRPDRVTGWRKKTVSKAKHPNNQGEMKFLASTRAGRPDRVTGRVKQTVFEAKQPITTAGIMFSAFPGRPVGPGDGSAKTDGF